MAQLIKAKFLKNDIPQGRPYTYYSKEIVKLGELVQINSQAKGVVVEVDVPDEEIKDFKDKVKTIIGKIEAKPQPKTFEEMQDNEELCEHCDWTNGEIPHRGDSVCEGSYCDGAYKAYLDGFDGGNQDGKA